MCWTHTLGTSAEDLGTLAENVPPTRVCSAPGRTGGTSIESPVRAAQDAATLLAQVPEWSRFPVADFRAPQPVDPEVGEWTHGWQFHASVARDSLFATSVHVPPLSTDHQPLRASQRGPCASRHFSCLTTCQETTFSAEPEPPHGRTILQVRRTVGRVWSPARSRIGLMKPPEPIASRSQRRGTGRRPAPD